MTSHGHEAAALDRRCVAWGLVGVAVTLAITFVGSDGLLWFDAALIGYLFLHVYSLSPLTNGEAAFNLKMQQYSSPFFMVVEWLLFAFVLFHSLNGIRIVIVDWADGAKYHKQLYRLSWILGVILFLAMGAIMFSHEIRNLFK